MLFSRDAVHQHLLVGLAVELALVDQARDEVDGAELAQQAGVEGDLVHPIQDLTRRLRRAPAEDRIDLHDDDVVRLDRKSTRLNSRHQCASRMPPYACKKKTQ